MNRLTLALAGVLAFVGALVFGSHPVSAQNCSGQPSGNTVCASPSGGGSGFPAFRSLVAADVPMGWGRFSPNPNQSTTPTVPWQAVDPWGASINCTGTTTQCLNEMLAASKAGGWPVKGTCQGTQFPGGTEPIFINTSSQVVVPVMQDQDIDFDASCTLNISVTTSAGVLIDSQGASHFKFNGKIVYNVTLPNGNTTANPSCAVLINPTTNTQDGFPGVYAGLLRIKAPVVVPVTEQTITAAANNGGGLIRLTVASTAAWTTGNVKVVKGVGGTTEANATWTITVVDGTHIDLQGSTFTHAYTSGGAVTGVATAAVCINTATGSTIQTELEFGEINSNNAAYFGIVVFGASLTSGLFETRIHYTQIHGALQQAILNGFSATNQTNYNGNIWEGPDIENSIIQGAAVSRGIDSYGSNEVYTLGAVDNDQGGLTQGVVFEAGANNNSVRYGRISGNSGAAFIDNGTCNSIQGPQGSSIAMWGTTSGCTKMVPAAAASGTLTAPSATDQLVSRATADTLTNKTLTDPVISRIFGNTTAGGELRLQSTSSGSPSGDFISFYVNGAEQQRLISGHQLVGSTTAQSIAAASVNPFLQIYEAGAAASIGFVREGGAGAGGAIFIIASSPATPHTGSYTALTAGSGLGTFSFAGDTGASLNAQGAAIRSQATGTWSATSSPANVSVLTTPVGAVGSTERTMWDSAGNIVFGNSTGGALATTATNGWPYMPSSAGTPTGVPATAYTGFVEFQYDTTNHKICVYDPTTPSWRCSAAM